MSSVSPLAPAAGRVPVGRKPEPAFAELAAATNFSFLRGASPADRMVLTSLMLDQSGLGIADRNSVAGVVRAWSVLRALRAGGVLPALKRRVGSGPGETEVTPGGPEEEALRRLLQERAQGFRLVTGARLVFADGTPDIVAHPETRAGWGRLCRLLTLGNRRTRKGRAISASRICWPGPTVCC